MLIRLLKAGITPGGLRVHDVVLDNAVPTSEATMGRRLPSGFLHEDRILPASDFCLADRKSGHRDIAARAFVFEPLRLALGRAHGERATTDDDHPRAVAAILKSLSCDHIRGDQQYPRAEQPYPAPVEFP